MASTKVIKIKCAEMGRHIADCYDYQQAEFFKAFLNECKSWGPSKYRDQFERIRDNLDEEQLTVLKALGQ